MILTRVWRGLKSLLRVAASPRQSRLFLRLVGDYLRCVEAAEKFAVLFVHHRKLDYRPADVLLRVSTTAELYRTRACGKEPWTVEWIESHIKKGEVLYDIGASVGAYSLLAARRLKGAVKVLAFEPSFSSYAALCHNVIINDCQESVQPFPLALSRRTGCARFQYADTSPGEALHVLGEMPAAGGPSGQAAYDQLVLSYALDDLVSGFGLPAPNHIKLDVDGAELGVLEGASRTLASPALRSLMVEVGDRERQGIVDLLSAAGFPLGAEFRRPAPGDPPSLAYCLFVRSGPGGVAGMPSAGP